MTCPISLESIPIGDDDQPLNRAYAIMTPNGSQVYVRSNLTEHLRHRNWWPHAGAGAMIVPDNVRASLGLPPRNAGGANRSNAASLFVDAVLNNDIASVRRLIASGANVNAVANNGWTPLHHAALFGRRAIVELLLQNGVNVNAVSSDGETPLHLAVDYGQRDIVALLIASGANVNAVNNNGETPLHSAASFEGNRAIVELLLRSGANVSIRNRRGRTARNHATRNTIRALLFNRPG